MYKMEINVSGQHRVFLFRGPGCRKSMLEWWCDYLGRAEAGEDIQGIRVWAPSGTRPTSSLNGRRSDPSTAEEHDPNNVRALDAG